MDSSGRPVPLASPLGDGDDTLDLGLPTKDEAPQAGTSLGRYLIISELGRGAMGVVLRAYDPKLQREVALKCQRAARLSSSTRQRMMFEAQAMAKVNHPNVVSVFDFEVQDGQVVLAMEFVPGQDLRGWLEQSRTPRAIVDVFVQAGRGLDAAHRAGLLHRDFKPANVLVTEDGVAKVTDFGVARIARPGQATEPDGPEPDDFVGTPMYMAPEQHSADALSASADQFAFCVALWEALVGTHPFAGVKVAALRTRKLAGPPTWPRPAPAMPKQVLAAIRRGLEPDPAQRWPSLPALLNVLSVDPKRRRNRIWVAAGMAAGLGLGAGVWQSWLAERAERCSARGNSSTESGMRSEGRPCTRPSRPPDAPTREQPGRWSSDTSTDMRGDGRSSIERHAKPPRFGTSARRPSWIFRWRASIERWSTCNLQWPSSRMPTARS